MRRAVELIIAALVCLTVANVARASSDCGYVTYRPNSSWGAFQIRAYGVDCATAQYVASGSLKSDHYGPGGPWHSYRIDSGHGVYYCQGYDTYNGMAERHYTCKTWHRRVYFIRAGGQG